MVAGGKHSREDSDDSEQRKNARRDAAARGGASTSSPLQAAAPAQQGTSPPPPPRKKDSTDVAELKQATRTAVDSANRKLKSEFDAAAAAPGKGDPPPGQDPAPPRPRAPGRRFCQHGHSCGKLADLCSTSSLQLGQPPVDDKYHVYNKMTLRAGFQHCTLHIVGREAELEERLGNPATPDTVARHTFVFVDAATPNEGPPLDNRERDHTIVQITAMVASGGREAASTQARNNAGGDECRPGDAGGGGSSCGPSNYFNVYVRTNDEAAKAGASKQAATGSAGGPADAEQQGASVGDELEAEGSPAEAPATAAVAAAAAAGTALPPAEALQLFWDWVLAQHERCQGAGADPGDIVLVSHYGFNFAFRLLAQQAEQLGVRMPPVRLADSLLWHKAWFGWWGNPSGLCDLADKLAVPELLQEEDQQQAAANGASQQQQQAQGEPKRPPFKRYRREHKFALADVRAMLVIVRRLAEQLLQKLVEPDAGTSDGDGSEAASAGDIWRSNLLALSTPLRDYVGRLGLEANELVE